MQIERSQRGDLAVVTITGPIVLGESARQFSETMAEILADEGRGVIVDMEAINYVDSTGLGELVGHMQRFEDQGRTLALSRPDERVLSLFRLTGLDKQIPIYASLDEAAAALK